MDAKPAIPRSALTVVKDAGVSVTALDSAPESTLRALAAIQSLLLSGYSPDAARRWLRTPCDAIHGDLPIDRLKSLEKDGVTAVLAAAYDRIAA